MKSLLALVILVSSAHAAPAFGVVLANDTSNARIEIADMPGASDVFLVAWTDLPGATPNGAMVYYKDQAAAETRYFAVGGGGLFAIVDRGGHTLIAGTLVPIYEVVQKDPDHPLRLRLESGKKLDVPAMLARYNAFEHVGTPNEGKPAIDSAVAAAAAHANKACGAHLAAQIQWAEFGKANKIALAKQAASVFEAIEPLCSDKDYRAAVQALTALRVELRADAGGLQLATSGTTLAVTLSDTSFNPRETARQWLANHL